MISAIVLASLLAAPPGYEATGQISFHVRGGVGQGASFDAERVIGPTANLTNTEGVWAGDIGGQNVSLDVSPTRIIGANVDLHIGQQGDKRSIRGNFFGQRLSLEYSAKTLSGRVGACSFSLDRKRAGVYEGTVGCMDRGARLPRTGYGILNLAGQAAEPEPPSPQFPLALVATLIG